MNNLILINKNLYFYNYLKNIIIILYKNKLNFLFFQILLNKQDYYNSLKNIFFFLKKKLLLINNNIIFYMKLFNIGLGYKNFTYKKKLYIYLGDSNYYKIIFNKEISILCKKNQLFFFSKFKNILFNFVNKISKIKKINLYKGKGIIPYINFKFMKLKKGKKKS